MSVTRIKIDISKNETVIHRHNVSLQQNYTSYHCKKVNILPIHNCKVVFHQENLTSLRVGIMAKK